MSKRSDEIEEKIATAVIVCFAGLIQFALAVAVLLFIYGVIRIVLHNAFGINLPDPFSALPAEWRKGKLP